MSYLNIGNNMSFENELINLINRYSIENGSDTPDFILARYIMNCLNAYEIAMDSRNSFFAQGSEEVV
jgi:hypothetical protein